MTMIPDCRTDKTYNKENLNSKDQVFVAGYDWCAENVVDNFFNNLNVYFDDDSHIMHMLNEELPKSLKEEDVETYGDLLRARINDWVEMERDELITSMIDAMGDDDAEGQSKEDNR